jgi:hypothetical protein
MCFCSFLLCNRNDFARGGFLFAQPPPPQLRFSTRQPRHHRANRDFKQVRDFLIRKLLKIKKSEHRALLKKVAGFETAAFI